MLCPIPNSKEVTERLALSYGKFALDFLSRFLQNKLFQVGEMGQTKVSLPELNRWIQEGVTVGDQVMEALVEIGKENRNGD